MKKSSIILASEIPIPMTLKKSLIYLLKGLSTGFYLDHIIVVWILFAILLLILYLVSLFVDITHENCLRILYQIKNFNPSIFNHNILEFIFFSIISYLLWTFWAGALYRGIAIQLANNKISLAQKIKFSLSHYFTLMLGPILLFICTGIVAGLVLCCWEVLQINIALIPQIILKVIATIISFFLIIFLLWLVPSCLLTPSLIYSSIVIDDCDHYDAVSRAVTYLWYRSGYFLLYLTCFIFLYCLILMLLILIFISIVYVLNLITLANQVLITVILVEVAIFEIAISVACYVGGKIAIYNLIRQYHENLPLTQIAE